MSIKDRALTQGGMLVKDSVCTLLSSSFFFLPHRERNNSAEYHRKLSNFMLFPGIEK